MTQKEFYQRIVELGMDTEVTAYAKERLAKLVESEDSKNAEHIAIRKNIVDCLERTPGQVWTAKAIAEVIWISTQKASYHLGALAKAGTIDKADTKPITYSVPKIAE